MTIARIIAGKNSDTWTCNADDNVAYAVAILASKRIGAVPVRDGDDDVAGIFSERDVLYSLREHGHAALSMKVREVMTTPVVAISSDTSVLEALALMTRRRIRHLPVIDDGRLAGFVSIGDLVKHRIDHIEAEANALRDYIQMA